MDSVMVHDATPVARLPPLKPIVLPPIAPVTVPPHCGDTGTANNLMPASVSVKLKPDCAGLPPLLVMVKISVSGALSEVADVLYALVKVVPRTVKVLVNPVVESPPPMPVMLVVLFT